MFCAFSNLVVKNAVMCKIGYNENDFIVDGEEDGNETDLNFPLEDDEDNDNSEVVNSKSKQDSDPIRQIIKKCKRMVQFFNKSVGANRSLKKKRKAGKTADGKIPQQLVSQVHIINNL